MRLRPDIAISENGFVFNPATGDSFAANPLAAEIVAGLQRGQEPAAIKADVLSRYEVAPAQLERDWDDLLAQLRAFALLDE